MRKQIWIFTMLALLVSFFGGCGMVPSQPAAVNPTTVETVPAVPTTIPTSAPTTIPTSAPTTVPTQAPAETTEPFIPTVTPVITAPQETKTVTTVEEFLNAIGPDREIILNAELFDLSTAPGYGETQEIYYYWYEEFDGPQLVIRDVENLTIRGTGEKEAVTISAVPRYANVLFFENCANIYLTGFTAGHTKEPGSCSGGVLYFSGCQDVLIEKTGLFGCGILGIQADHSKEMQIVENDIYECSVGGIELSVCENVKIDGNTFRDLGGPIYRLYSNKNITENGVELRSH